MKTAIKIFIGVLLLLVLFACPESPVTNPFDPECPKEKWTPANFKAVQSENKLDLTWEQENMHISGFKIDRKVGTRDWTEVALLEKTVTSWSDSDLKGGEVHQYHLYAYAGDNISNTVPAQATPVFTASLTTTAQSDLTCNSATLGGNISTTGGANITERGIVYSKSASPTTSNTKITMVNGEGSFNQSVTVLEETTTYYVRAYAINSAGTSYGNEVSFITPACALEITNPYDPDCPKEIWSPSNFQAVQSENKLDLTWQQDNMNIDGFKIERKVGHEDWNNVASPGKTATSWSDSDLKGGEVHQYRLYAYAGNNISNTVTAQATPVFTASLTTAAQTDLTCNSATLGGNVTDDGGATVTERGIVYATTPNPTTSDTKVPIGSGTGLFSTSVSGFSPSTTYYVRAYAISSAGENYGEEKTFSTPVLASLTTATPTNLTKNSATLGGTIASDGGATVTERGIVYSTNSNPTTSDTKIVMGSGAGVFSQTVSGLTSNTRYYVRSYAINCVGTSYGSEKPFITEGELTGTFTDARDGNTYKWVKIGNQIWMAENLAYLPSVSPPSEGSYTLPYYYVYGYKGTDVNAAKATDNYKTYGVLYNWPAAVKACPKGWHLPADAEWKELEISIGMSEKEADKSGNRGTNEGAKLKATNGWYSKNGTDNYGFTALPSGIFYGGLNNEHGFYSIGELCYWWNSTEYSDSYAWYRHFFNDNGFIDRNAELKPCGYNVRCIKD